MRKLDSAPCRRKRNLLDTGKLAEPPNAIEELRIQSAEGFIIGRDTAGNEPEFQYDSIGRGRRSQAECKCRQRFGVDAKKDTAAAKVAAARHAKKRDYEQERER